ncbi:MAG TPA: caspase family protein, partial [Vicinamibacteria bacterium]
MMVQRMVLASLFGFLAGNLASASVTVRRLALSAGFNYGGADRPQLRYAVSDAENFAHVMATLGGVEDADLVLLKQPSLFELEEALDQLRGRIASSRRLGKGDPVRTEVVLYFSGHANDTGLLLGRETFSYRSLRNWMDLVEADVRIAVLDACASGAITRLKGGRHRKPFLVDASSSMRGHAFLTSSSADEVAQESDGIGASFFTHYLVSGLRGAADTSADGRVTLNEAYQFAFNETLGQTTETRAGAQHPAYDINLSGTGEVVITDLRQTSSTLVLEKGLGGRFYIRNAQDQLVVELYKPHGRQIELGLEPGNYEVRCEVESSVLVSSAELEDGGSVTMQASDFVPGDSKPVMARGGAPVDGQDADIPFGGLDRRHRLGVSFGIWNHSGSAEGPRDPRGFSSSVNGPGGSFGYAYWFREDLAFTLNFSGHVIGIDSGPYDDATAIASSLFGVRYYPLAPMQVRPYLSIATGPVWVASSEIGAGWGSTFTTAIGGQVGGGLDAQINRWFMIGGKLGYNFMSDLSGPAGLNFNGWEAGIELGWVFGKGRSSG